MKKILFLLLLISVSGCALDQDHNPTAPIVSSPTPVTTCSPSYSGAKSVSITVVEIRGTYIWDAGSQVTLLWDCQGGQAINSSVAYVSLVSDGFCHNTLTIPASGTLPNLSFDGEISGLTPDSDYVVLFECDGIFSKPVTFRTL